MSNWNWADDAACKGVDVNLLYPPDGHECVSLDDVEARAHRLCGACPVRAQCAAAGDAGREVGVWGGVYRTDGGRGYQRQPLLPNLELGELPSRRPTDTRAAKVRALTAQGRSAAEIAVEVGVSERQVVRERRRAS